MKEISIIIMSLLERGSDFNFELPTSSPVEQIPSTDEMVELEIGRIIADFEDFASSAADIGTEIHLGEVDTSTDFGERVHSRLQQWMMTGTKQPTDGISRTDGHDSSWMIKKYKATLVPYPMSVPTTRQEINEYLEALEVSKKLPPTRYAYSAIKVGSI